VRLPEVARSSHTDREPSKLKGADLPAASLPAPGCVLQDQVRAAADILCLDCLVEEAGGFWARSG
jgi:hypothetical protein